MSSSTFKELWSQYINTEHNDYAFLKQCLSVATTVDEALLVFAGVTYPTYVSGIPTPAIKRALEFVESIQDAERVLTIASVRRFKNNKGSFVFPDAVKAAQEKLTSLKSASN